MIKLIASDLDGTILLNGAQSVDESLIKVIDRLVKNGMIFAPASGRQMTSLKRLFEPVSDKLMYICENGALVKYKGETIAKNAMDRQLAMDIIKDIYAKENCEVLVSGEDTAYVKPKSQEYYHRMTQVVNYHTTLVEDFEDIKEDIIKISVCDMSGIVHSADYFTDTWSDRAEVAVSGELYLDFTALGVSKGHAMQQIQQKLGLRREECMAFGDNYNDIAMLDQVEYSYVMEKAVDEIKKHANYESAWVEGTLTELF